MLIIIKNNKNKSTIFTVNTQLSCHVMCCIEMPEKRVGVTVSVSPTMSLCQETLVKWFANYTMALKKTTDTAGQHAFKARSVTDFMQLSTCT